MYVFFPKSSLTLIVWIRSISIVREKITWATFEQNTGVLSTNFTLHAQSKNTLYTNGLFIISNESHKTGILTVSALSQMSSCFLFLSETEMNSVPRKFFHLDWNSITWEIEIKKWDLSANLKENRSFDIVDVLKNNAIEKPNLIFWMDYFFFETQEKMESLSYFTLNKFRRSWKIGWEKTFLSMPVFCSR